jgi:hypothetical protein
LYEKSGRPDHAAVDGSIRMLPTRSGFIRRRVVDRFIPKGDRYMRGGRPNLDAADIRHLWDKAKASVKGDPPPEDPKKTFTLEVRPEEVKALYARVLALQSLVDERLDPREIEYLYVFMSRIGLSPDSREEVRQALATEEVSPADVVRLVEEVISAVPDNREEIATAMIKDLIQVSRADNAVISFHSRFIATCFHGVASITGKGRPRRTGGLPGSGGLSGRRWGRGVSFGDRTDRIR